MTNRKKIWLLADVGGTNTRVAIFGIDGQLSSVEYFKNDDFDGLIPLLKAYLNQSADNAQVEGAAIAVAGPVLGTNISLTNRDWSFERQTLCDALGASYLEVINDFAANALALATLNENEWLPIGGGDPEANATMVVIGPGTGLGVSAAIPAVGSWIPVESEGGHVTLAPSTQDESELIRIAREIRGHIDAESFLSGSGLPLLYECVARQSGTRQDGGLYKSLTAEQISQLAEDGEAVALATMAHFFSMLGSMAGNLALTFNATGGVYLAGGILPRYTQELVSSRFRQRFVQKGECETMLESIPTRLITIDTLAIRGLATLARF